MRIEILQGDAARFAGLTFPRYAPLLADVRRPVLAAALFRGPDPVGLALATVEERYARLLSLYVAPQERGAGHGSGLLAHVQGALAPEADLIWAEYTSSLPQRQGFEGAMRRAGWDAPTTREVRVSGPLGPVLALAETWPGLRGARDARLGLTLEPWSDEASDDAAALAELAREPGFIPGLAPGLYLARIDAPISLRIRQHGRLVGWLLAERLTDPAPGHEGAVRLNWPTGYVTGPLWQSGILIRAFVHSLRLARPVYGEEAVASLYAALPRVTAMVRRRSGNTAITSIEIRQAVRTLS